MTDRRLLAAGERAAFHGRPGDGIAPLRQYLATSPPQDHERGRAQWLLGICLTAVGQFGTAAQQLQPLLRLPAEAPEHDRVTAGAAACTLGSVHRQIGRFEEARAYDEWAARVVPEDARVAFVAQVGQSADAVGRGDTAQAGELLERARGLVSDNPSWWRERVRLGWVECEVALAQGRAHDAKEPLETSVRESEQMGAPRHVAKSLLFLAATIRDLGDPSAVTVLGRSALLAESLGAWPLVWAARGTMAGWLNDSDPALAQRCRQSARYAVGLIAADLPPALASQWLQRPDVAPLVAT